MGIGVLRMKKMAVWSGAVIAIFTRYLNTLAGCCKRWFCLHEERLCWMHKRAKRVVTIWEESTGHRQFFDLWQSRLCGFWVNKHTFYGFLWAIREISNIESQLEFSQFEMVISWIHLRANSGGMKEDAFITILTIWPVFTAFLFRVVFDLCCNHRFCST